MMARPKYGRVLTIAVTNLDDRKIARTSSLAKLDRKRAHKGSNEDWVNPHDPEAGITKLMGSAVSFGGADHRERLRFLADVFPVRSDVLDGVAYHQSDRATEQRIQASNQCHGSDGR